MITSLEVLAEYLIVALPETAPASFIGEKVEEVLGMEKGTISSGNQESLNVQTARSMTAVVASRLGHSTSIIARTLRANPFPVENLVRDFVLVKEELIEIIETPSFLRYSKELGVYASQEEVCMMMKGSVTEAKEMIESRVQQSMALFLEPPTLHDTLSSEKKHLADGVLIQQGKMRLPIFGTASDEKIPYQETPTAKGIIPIEEKKETTYHHKVSRKKKKKAKPHPSTKKRKSDFAPDLPVKGYLDYDGELQVENKPDVLELQKRMASRESPLQESTRMRMSEGYVLFESSGRNLERVVNSMTANYKTSPASVRGVNAQESEKSLLAAVTIAYALHVKGKVPKDDVANILQTTTETVEQYVALYKGILDGSVTSEKLKTYKVEQ